MSANDEPGRQDQTDEAVHEVLEYLALSDMVEGELNAVAPSIRRIILALLVADEAAGALTPYRAYLLSEMRS
jgi:hypothetical protein